MKLQTLLLAALLPLLGTAQNKDSEKYLRGAVPQNEQGVVVFTRTYEVPGKTRTDIYNLLHAYVDTQVLHGANALEQCRFAEEDADAGTLAARVEEYLYFTRKAWVTHRTRFFYDLVFSISDGSFTVAMQRLHYLYEPDETPNGKLEDYRAEDWITDAEALTPKGQLSRVAGKKFRVSTIDRKDQLFLDAARAAGAKLKTRLVEVDD